MGYTGNSLPAVGSWTFPCSEVWNIHRKVFTISRNPASLAPFLQIYLFPSFGGHRRCKRHLLCGLRRGILSDTSSGSRVTIHQRKPSISTGKLLLELLQLPSLIPLDKGIGFLNRNPSWNVNFLLASQQ